MVTFLWVRKRLQLQQLKIFIICFWFVSVLLSGYLFLDWTFHLGVKELSLCFKKQFLLEFGATFQYKFDSQGRTFVGVVTYVYLWEELWVACKFQLVCKFFRKDLIFLNIVRIEMVEINTVCMVCGQINNEMGKNSVSWFLHCMLVYSCGCNTEGTK